MPDLTTLFKIVEIDDRGFSRGYTVVDSREHEWNVKLPPEAFSEVTASRIITPADVRWICERLSRLTDEQWQDAFRAGGYDHQLADRFIRRLKQKMTEGLALKD